MNLEIHHTAKVHYIVITSVGYHTTKVHYIFTISVGCHLEGAYDE